MIMNHYCNFLYNLDYDDNGAITEYRLGNRALVDNWEIMESYVDLANTPIGSYAVS